MVGAGSALYRHATGRIGTGLNLRLGMMIALMHLEPCRTLPVAQENGLCDQTAADSGSASSTSIDKEGRSDAHLTLS